MVVLSEWGNKGAYSFCRETSTDNNKWQDQLKAPPKDKRAQTEVGKLASLAWVSD